MSTIKDLAAILSKAQGRIDRETGEPIDIGAEVARIKSRERALAEFVAAFDAWDEMLAAGAEPARKGGAVDIWGETFGALLAAREALDATEDS